MADQLPMPTAVIPVQPLTSFKTLSFDIYETLIQWESSIVAQLERLAARVQPNAQPSPFSLAQRFAQHEATLQTTSPDMKYDKLLGQAYLQLASDLGTPLDDTLQAEATSFGHSVGSWPPFPDTLEAMARLGRRYKLIVLSNVDSASFARTNAGPLQGLAFWRVYTAEDIGAYKPSLKTFEYLLDRLAQEDPPVAKEQNLHIAQSLHHDHRPAKEMGMPSVWINRKGAGTGSGAGSGGAKQMHEDGELGYGWRFNTLGEFADEVERQFAQQ